MSIIPIINIGFFLLLSVFPIVFFSKYFKLGIFNPISIPFLIFFPVQLMKLIGGPSYILEEGLNDKWFNFALMVTNIELLMKVVLILLIIRIIERNSFLMQGLFHLFNNYRLKKIRMLLCAFVFLLLFFVCFFLLARNFGILNWVLDPRTGYQFYRTGAGHWYAFCLLFLSLFYTISLLYCRNIFSSLLVFVFSVSLVFLLGSKGFILTYLIYFMCVLWFKKSRYLGFGIFFISPLIFVLMLINFNPDDIEDILRYFDYYVNSAMYYKAYFNNEIDLYYGYLWLTDFYKYLPRVIFESKPYVYGFLHVNEFFFPGAAEATHTPAFGGPVPLFADFGFVGVVLFSFFDFSYAFSILLIFYIYKFHSLNSIRNHSTPFVVFVWLLAPSFLVFFGGVQMIFIFSIIVSFIIFINRIKLR